MHRKLVWLVRASQLPHSAVCFALLEGSSSFSADGVRPPGIEVPTFPVLSVMGPMSIPMKVDTPVPWSKGKVCFEECLTL